MEESERALRERWNRKRNEEKERVSRSSLTLRVVGYKLQGFKCDYSESLKFLCSPGLTAGAFFLPSITLNLFFLLTPSAYFDLSFPEIFRKTGKTLSSNCYENNQK